MTTIDTHDTTPAKILEAMNRALAGEDVFVSQKGKRLFKITEVEKVSEKPFRKKRQFGFRKGALKYMAPDFNEPLDDFEDYMPN